MSLTSQWLLIACLGAAGFGGGRWWSQQDHAAPTKAPTIVEETTPAPASDNSKPAALAGATSSERELQFLLAAQSTSAETWIAQWNAAASDPEHRMLLATTWIALNPSKFHDLLRDERVTYDQDASKAKHLLFKEWAHHDPMAAFKAARSVADPFGYQSELREVVDAILQDDFPLGFKLGQQVTGKYYNWKVPASAYEKDPGAFLLTVLPVETKFDNWKTSVQQAIGYWAEKDMPALTLWLRDHREWSKRVMPEIIRQLSKTDPAGVAEAVAEMEPNKNREGYAMDLIKPWAKKDPAAALKWAQENVLDFQFDVVDDIMEAALEKDLTAAATLAEGLAQGKARDESLSKIADAMAEKDAVKAAAWVQALPDDSAKWKALRSIATKWAEADLGAATAFAIQHPEGPANVGEGVMRAMEKNNPAGALNFIQKLPDIFHRSLASEVMIPIAREKGVAVAGALWAGISDPAMKKLAVRYVVYPHAQNQRDLTEAIQWVNSLGNKEYSAVAKECLLSDGELDDDNLERVKRELR